MIRRFRTNNNGKPLYDFVSIIATTVCPACANDRMLIMFVDRFVSLFPPLFLSLSLSLSPASGVWMVVCTCIFLIFSVSWVFQNLSAACFCGISQRIYQHWIFSASVLSLKTFFASFAPSSLCYPPYTTYTIYTTPSQHTVSVAQPERHQPIIIHQPQHHLSESPRPPPSLPLPLPHSTLQPR